MQSAYDAIHEELVRMVGIDKIFPGVRALLNAQFELLSGEVHALVGENGAGKSTLMKILTGIHKRDAGTIYIKGVPVEIDSAVAAQQLGISIIHQELNLMRDLTVAENIFIGREPCRGILLDKKKQNEMASRLLQKLNINISPTAKVSSLTVAKQQMVEITKALSFDNTKIMIMDEPTAALTDTEISELFHMIRALRDKGVGIIYISHRLVELSQISDRITVMRDGQYINTVNTSSTSIDEIIKMMVGRIIYEPPKEKSTVPESAPVALEVRSLRSRDVKNVSFALHKGEILGFAGLMGAGRTETARLICGADKRDGGEIYINGTLAEIKTPGDAVRLGIGYLSEDRKQYGLCLQLSVADNTVLPSLDKFINRSVINSAKIKTVSNDFRERINIKTPTVDTAVRTLSGGNQQKVVLAKWLVKNCDILIFDEPTRGIDVGAKNEIYKLMSALASQGKAIIMISSDMTELLRMSDRVVVMCEGEKTGELAIEEATQEKIMSLAASNSVPSVSK